MWDICKPDIHARADVNVEHCYSYLKILLTQMQAGPISMDRVLAVSVICGSEGA